MEVGRDKSTETLGGAAESGKPLSDRLVAVRDRMRCDVYRNGASRDKGAMLAITICSHFRTPLDLSPRVRSG